LQPTSFFLAKYPRQQLGIVLNLALGANLTWKFIDGGGTLCGVKTPK